MHLSRVIHGLCHCRSGAGGRAAVLKRVCPNSKRRLWSAVSPWSDVRCYNLPRIRYLSSSSSSSSTTDSGTTNNPYAADFADLVRHLRKHQGDVSDEYWQTKVMMARPDDNHPNQDDPEGIIERWRYLATQLRDSSIVPPSARPYALQLWEKVVETMDVLPKDNPHVREKAEVWTDMALYYQRHGSESDLEKAVVYMQQAVQVYQSLIDSSSSTSTSHNKDDEHEILPALAAATMHLALLHQQGRQWEDALQAFGDGVMYQQRVLGNAHTAVADTYQNMGHLQGQLQRFDAAADSYRQALSIYQNIISNQQHTQEEVTSTNLAPSQAGAHHNLGLALQYQVAQIMGSHSTTATTTTQDNKQRLGKLIEEAITHLQIALQLRQSALGTQHVDTAGSHMALAQFLSQLQQSDVAVQHFAAAAQIWQDLLDATSSATGEGVDASASSSTLQKLSPAQIPLARRHLATVYNNKGAAILQQQQQQQQQHASESDTMAAAAAALQDYTKAQEALQPLLSDSNNQGIPPSLMLEWVTTHNNIGMVHLQLGSLDEALQAHHTAQVVLEQSVGQQSSLLPHLQFPLAHTYGSIGKVYQAQNKYEAALAALEQAHECFKVVHGDRLHPDMAASCNSLGLVHTQLEHYDQALEAYQTAEAMFRQTLGPNHAHTGSCALNTGLTLVQQGKLSEAQGAFARAHDIWKIAFGPDHPQTQTASQYSTDPASAISNFTTVPQSSSGTGVPTPRSPTSRQCSTMALSTTIKSPTARRFSTSSASTVPELPTYRHRRHLIFGANTDVGKTIVSAGLLRSSRVGDDNLPALVRYFKPMQCGGSDENFVNHVAKLDSKTISSTGMMRPYHAKTLFNWETAASPHTASRKEGIPMSDTEIIEKIKVHFQEDGMADTSTITWYETAGGVLSPAAASPGNDTPFHARFSQASTSSPMHWGWQPQADLYREMASSTTTILVGDARLGGISATLTSLESLILRGYHVPAIVLINPSGADDIHANSKAISEYTTGRYDQNTPIKVVNLPSIPADISVPLDNWYQSDVVTKEFKELDQYLAADWTEYVSRTNAADDKVIDKPALPEASFSLHLAQKVSQNGILALKAPFAQKSLQTRVLALDKYSWAAQCSTWLPNTTQNLDIARDIAQEFALRTYQTRMRVSPEDKDSIEWSVCRHEVPSNRSEANEEAFDGDDFSWVSAQDLVLEAPTLAFVDGTLTICFPEGLEASDDTTTEFESVESVLDLNLRRISPKLYSQYKELIEMQWLVYEHSGVNRKIGAIIIEPVLSRDQKFIDPLWQRALIEIGEARNIPIVFDEASSDLAMTEAKSSLDVDPDVALLASHSSTSTPSILTVLCSQEVLDATEKQSLESSLTETAASGIDCRYVEHQLHLLAQANILKSPKLHFLEDEVRKLSMQDSVVRCFSIGSTLTIDVTSDEKTLEKRRKMLGQMEKEIDVSVRFDGNEIVLVCDPFLGREKRQEIIACLAEILR